MFVFLFYFNGLPPFTLTPLDPLLRWRGVHTVPLPIGVWRTASHELLGRIRHFPYVISAVPWYERLGDRLRSA